MELTRFMVLIALLGFSLLCAYAIYAISSITKFIKDIHPKVITLTADLNAFIVKSNITLDEVTEIRNDIHKTILSLDQLQTKVNESLTNYDRTSDEIRNFVSNTNSKIERIGKTIEPFEDLATSIYDKVSTPVNQTLGIINAVTKGLNVFRSRFKR